MGRRSTTTPLPFWRLSHRVSVTSTLAHKLNPENRLFRSMFFIKGAMILRKKCRHLKSMLYKMQAASVKKVSQSFPFVVPFMTKLGVGKRRGEFGPNGRQGQFKGRFTQERLSDDKPTFRLVQGQAKTFRSSYKQRRKKDGANNSTILSIWYSPACKGHLRYEMFSMVAVPKGHFHGLSRSKSKADKKSSRKAECLKALCFPSSLLLPRIGNGPLGRKVGRARYHIFAEQFTCEKQMYN